MKDVELVSRLESLGMPPAKAREVTRLIRDELHPRAAVAATMLRASGEPGLSGVDVGRTANLTATGAKIGSVVPGIGTAIGAAVGAVASLIGINKGTKPQRRARAQEVLAQLRALPPDYQGRMIEFGQGREPTSGFILLLQAVHYAGWQPDWGDIWTNNPGNMNRFSELIIENAGKAMRAVVGAPVGAPLTIQLNTHMDNMRSRELTYSFTNPGYQSPQQFAQLVIGPIVSAMLGNMKTRNKGGPAAAVFPEFQLVAALLADKWHAEVAPQANPSTQVATQPVAQVPAPVVRDAAVIANQVAQAGVTPAVVTPTPATPPNTPPPVGVPAVAQPLAPAVSSFAPVSTGLPPTQDMTAGLLQTLLATQAQANMVSPAAQRVLVDVAATGVQQTPAGPPALPSWVVPAAIGGAALLAAVVVMGRK